MPLKFNDKLIALDLPTYNVTVLPSSNGSVTATPSSGVPGTIVSLSNTPDQGYVLQGYQLTGSSLIDSDKFMIKKSDVSVQPSFIIAKQVWYNVATEQSVAGGRKTVDLSSYVPETSLLGYITWIFDAYIAGGNGAARVNLNVRSAKDKNDMNNSNWGMYNHNIYSRPAFLYDNGYVDSDWRTADGEASHIVTLETNKAIGTTYWNGSTYGTIKIAFDRANRVGYFYMNGNYLGYRSNLPFDPIELCAVRLYADIGSSSEVAKCRNLKVAGFATIDYARNWDGTID